MDKEVDFLTSENIQFIVFYSGDLGNRWRYGHVTVQSHYPYQLAFEAVVGTGFQVRKNLIEV